MTTMLPSLAAIVEDLFPVFTRPSFATHCQFLVAWLMHLGKHTLFRTCQTLQVGPSPQPCHPPPSDRYYNFFERSAWEPAELARRVGLMILTRLPFGNCITLLVDDTLSHKRGKSVWGLGWFRDAVASTQKRVATASGHNWVVIAIAFRSPWTGAPILALPLLARLHLPGKGNPGPAQLAQEMLGEIVQWYPDKNITLVGDGAYAGERLLKKLQAGVEFVGRMRADSALHSPNVPRQAKSKRGPKPKKGPRLPSPKAAVQKADRKRGDHGDWLWRKITVELYGRQRQLKVLSYEALWPKVVGHRRIQVVVVRDVTGTMKDAYLFTTDLQATAEWVVRQYSWRWSIEVVFASSKQIMDLEAPQHWCQSSVEKVAPWIWSLQSVLQVWYLSEGRDSTEAKEMRQQLGPWQTEWSLAHVRKVFVRATLNHTIEVHSATASQLQQLLETLKNWAILAL